MITTSRGLQRGAGYPSVKRHCSRPTPALILWRSRSDGPKTRASSIVSNLSGGSTQPKAIVPAGSDTQLAAAQLTPEDQVNPPARTRPPALQLPERDASSSTVSYWFRIGRAYGKFYWTGLKAAWSNHKDSAALRQSLREFRNKLPPDQAAQFEKVDKSITGNILCLLELELRNKASGAVLLASQSRGINRSDFQVLIRDKQDFPKLPQFLLLFAIAGEYLPLLVPFVPGMVPRTCHIPKQILGMRRAVEKRRAASFEANKDASPLKPESEHEDRASDGELILRSVAQKTGYSYRSANRAVERASSELLLHYSTSLGLHARLWDRIGLSPPSWLLQRRTRRRFQYLLADDLLLSLSANGVKSLNDEELQMACVERGINVLDRNTDALRADLRRWQHIVRGPKPSGDYAVDVALSLPSSRWDELHIAGAATTNDNK